MNNARSESAKDRSSHCLRLRLWDLLWLGLVFVMLGLLSPDPDKIGRELFLELWAAVVGLYALYSVASRKYSGRVEFALCGFFVGALGNFVGAMLGHHHPMLIHPSPVQMQGRFLGAASLLLSAWVFGVWIKRLICPPKSDPG
jgi:hypothetical protein